MPVAPADYALLSFMTGSRPVGVQTELEHPHGFIAILIHQQFNQPLAGGQVSGVDLSAQPVQVAVIG
jgi:hypothetical protein